LVVSIGKILRTGAGARVVSFGSHDRIDQFALAARKRLGG